MHVLTIGAVCFGVMLGYITYRTLIRTTEHAAIGDLASVVGAVGGAAVTTLFGTKTDLFGWYAIGLIGGFAVYGLLYLCFGKTNFGTVMGFTTQSGTQGPNAPRQ